MSTATNSLAGLVQGLALIALSPGILGLLRWWKALFQGRRRGWRTLGQPYRDLGRSMAQACVRAGSYSWLFGAAPLVLWGCYGTLAFAVPFLGWLPLLRIDLIALVYLLALARFAIALGGLDAGAPLGGLGASRSMFLNIPTEAALILVGAALALHSGTLSIVQLVEAHAELGLRLFMEPDLVLVAFALLITLLLEAGRVPIDNPATHLELTMSQKAITLEYAGRDLLLIEWAEAVKLGVFFALFAAFFVWPHPLEGNGAPNRWLSAGLSLAVLVPCTALLGFYEATRPKWRLRKVRIPALLSIGLSVSAILFIVVKRWGTPG